jgi:TonB family protein
MKKERKDESFIKQPYFKGGEKALVEFMGKNLVMPESSMVLGIEGDVHLKYDIDYKGKVIDVKIISGLDEACNAEAIRVVRMLTFIVPKNPRGLKVTFHRNMRVHFRKSAIQALPASDPEPVKPVVQPAVTYQITTIQKGQNTPAGEQKITYSYTIKLS